MWQIAMVIDLTNTSRYYQPQEWVKGGVKHVKVYCATSVPAGGHPEMDSIMVSGRF